MLGLAVDQPEPVKAFLKKTPLDFAVALAGPEGLGLVRELGNPAGAYRFLSSSTRPARSAGGVWASAGWKIYGN